MAQLHGRRRCDVRVRSATPYPRAIGAIRLLVAGRAANARAELLSVGRWRGALDGRRQGRKQGSMGRCCLYRGRRGGCGIRLGWGRVLLSRLHGGVIRRRCEHVLNEAGSSTGLMPFQSRGSA